MRRWWVVLLFLVLLVGGGYLVYRARAEASTAQTAQWKTVALSRGDLEATVGATGTVRSRQSAVLVWQVSGVVGKVFVREGEGVPADTVLAELRPDTWPQTLLSARTSLLNAQQQLDDLRRNAQVQYAQALQNLAVARQQLKSAEWRYNSIVLYWDEEKAQKEYDKWHNLVQSLQQQLHDPAMAAMQSVIRVQLEQAKRQEQVAKNNLHPSEEDKAKAAADYQLAKAQVAHWEQEVQRWQDGPPEAQVALLEAQIAAAQATLDLAKIKAPFTGTVTEVHSRPGDVVSPGSVAFRLDDLSALLVDVDVSEIDINAIRPGQKATLTLDAVLGREYHGVVEKVARVGTTTPTGINFTVTVRLTDADALVKPGMTSAVTIFTERKTGVLLVPNRAVRTVEGQTVVYVLRPGASEPIPVPVVLGATANTVSEVLKGDLKEGDLVVLNPPTQGFNLFGGR
ncbi:MAG TPA: efflux RND transporter periplasmic adaptor subunit [Anaerolineae bacterium]|nr:efflux RND transporter periplasmic adaptor subunit [Anaerolineae bacterium]